MAINDKLNRIKEIKEDIKQALIDKGVEVTDEDSFGSYADKITNIPMEGGDPYYEDLYNLRTNNGTDMAGLFARMSGDSLDLTGLDVSQCTNMNYMFANSAIESSLYAPNLDTSNVTSMNNMCASLRADTVDLSGWDTSNVTNLLSLFQSANVRKINLSNWNTSNVTNMGYAFGVYNNNMEELIIPDWDMTNVTNSANFFTSGSSYNTNLRFIDLSRSNDYTISKVMSYLPTRTETTYGDVAIPADSSQEVIDEIIAKYWRPIGVSLIPETFQITSELDEVLLNKKTKIVAHSHSPWYTYLSGVEFESSDESIATVNGAGEVSAVSPGVVEIYAYIKDRPDIKSNTISISVSETDSTPYVIKFKGTSTPASNNYMTINGSNIKLSNMQYNADTGVYTYDVGSEITSIKFNGSSASYANTITELLKFDFNGNNITDMTRMFDSCRLLTYYDFSEWDVSNVNSMDRLFYTSGFHDLSSIEDWNVGNVKQMESLFQGAQITDIDLTKWDINITQLTNMFCDCTLLKTVKLPTLAARIMVSLFNNCISLELADISKLDTIKSPLSGASYMFTNVPSTCKVYINEQTWNPNYTEAACSFTGTFIRLNFTPEYYTEYSIDSSTATFNMRSIDSINSGAYLPELSNGYDAVLLTLNDGSITTDLNTEANQVSSIKIYYPEETSYVKFANTKVKEVNHLSGSNITDCTGMFTNCVYLEKADLTSLDSTKVTVDTTMFEGVNTEAEVTFNESWDIPESDMGRGEPDKYITGFDVDYADGTEITKEGNYFNIYPWEQGCNVAFNVEFVDYTYSEPDTLYAWISDEEYENYKNGSSNMIRCHAYQQIHGQSGSAIMVIYETNSQIEMRIPVTIKEDSSTGGGDEPDVPQEGKVNVTVHYYNPNGEYGCGEWIVFNKVDDPSAGTGSDFGYEDDFGRYTIIQLDKDTAYNVSASYQGTNFATEEFTFTEDTELWVIYGDSTIYTQKPESGWTPAKHILIINYQDSYDPYNNPYVELSLNEYNENPIQCALNSTNDFGQYGQVELEFNQTYWITYYNNGILIGTCPSTITMDSNKEIWIVRPEDYVTEKPGADTVDFTVHFKDIRNAFDELYVEWNEPEYRGTTYSLSDAQTDDYGKYIVVQVSKDKDNYFTFRDTDGIYNPFNPYIDLTDVTSLWFDFGANQYSLNTPTDANISGDEVSLTVNYIPIEGQGLGSITVQDGAYTRSISTNYNSDNNEYYIQTDVLVGPGIQIETNGVWHSFDVSESKEIWLLPYNYTIYETRPDEIPSYTKFNPIIHLYVPDDSYELGYTCYISAPGYGYSLNFDGTKDEFGIYGTVEEYCPMYTGVQYDIQFDYESFFRSVVFTEPVAELWFILNDENVYYEQPTITRE